METSYADGGPLQELWEGTNPSAHAADNVGSSASAQQADMATATEELTILETGGQDEDSERGSEEAPDPDTDHAKLSPQQMSVTGPSSPPLTPIRDFAPRGRPTVRMRFRDRIPLALERLDIPSISKSMRFADIRRVYQRAVTSTVDRHGTKNFLDQLKYLINSSQLLDAQPLFGPVSGTIPLPTHGVSPPPRGNDGVYLPWTTNGVLTAIALSCGFVVLIRWFWVGGMFILSARRLLMVSALLGCIAASLIRFLRGHRLVYVQEQTLAETKVFIQAAAELDNLAQAALGFISEVELIARGYRLSLSLPPLSGLENPRQNVKSLKIRKELVNNLQAVIRLQHATAKAIRKLSSPAQLDFMDINKGYNEEGSEEKMRILEECGDDEARKIPALRQSLLLSQEVRKGFLLGLFCLQSHGSSQDSANFTTALESLRDCNSVSRRAIFRINKILEADELFNETQTPSKSPVRGSDSHARWRDQIRKIGNMNMTIRNLQARVALLTEEATDTINGAEDISHLGPLFMSQYETIGKDIRALQEAWEAGKASLAIGIDDKNERRLSSRSSSTFSPTGSIGGGLGSVSEEGDRDDAYRKLNGDYSAPPTPDSPLELEIYEAIAARPTTLLSREERLARVKDERRAKAQAKDRAIANGWIMGELKDVLKGREARKSVSTSTPTRLSVATQRAVTMPPVTPIRNKNRLSLPLSHSVHRTEESSGDRAGVTTPPTPDHKKQSLQQQQQQQLQKQQQWRRSGGLRELKTVLKNKPLRVDEVEAEGMPGPVLEST